MCSGCQDTLQEVLYIHILDLITSYPGIGLGIMTDHSHVCMFACLHVGGRSWGGAAAPLYMSSIILVLYLIDIDRSSRGECWKPSHKSLVYSIALCVLVMLWLYSQLLCIWAQEVI